MFGYLQQIPNETKGHREDDKAVEGRHRWRRQHLSGLSIWEGGKDAVRIRHWTDGWRERERGRERQTDRQTDRQSERQTVRKKDRQKDKKSVRQTDRQIVRQSNNDSR